jgi:preprotein translocase subunit SecG
MSLLIGFLTFVLVVTSLLLILLILIQLPKKEAGMGVAFGGGATDALFGAGSGNVLTKVTKYCAGGFLALSLVLSIMNGHLMKSSSTRVRKALEGKAAAAAAAPATAAAPKPATNLLLTTTNIAAPAVPAQPASSPAPAPAPAPGK